MEEDRDKQGLPNTPPDLPVIKKEGGFSSLSPPPPLSLNLRGKKEPPPSEIKSSIRTMKSDIEAISKGKSPIDIYTKREIKVLPKEKAVEPILTPSAGEPKSIPTKPPLVKLGELKKTESFKISPSIGRISPPELPVKKKLSPSKPTSGMITVPSQKLIFSRFLVPILILAVVAGFFTWFFAIRSEPGLIVEESPSPTPEFSETPVVVPENKFITGFGVDPVAELSNFLEKLNMAPGEIKSFDMISGVGQEYDFLELSLTFFVVPPPEIMQILKNSKVKLVVYGQIESFDGTLPKRFGFVMEVDQSIDMAQLKDWEPTLTSDMKDIFSLDVNDPQTDEFQDNIHNNVAIRYRNFSVPDETIDYAIISDKNNKKYFALMNSRESIYALIDNIEQIFVMPAEAAIPTTP